jgi:hypothetical protein
LAELGQAGRRFNYVSQINHSRGLSLGVTQSFVMQRSEMKFGLACVQVDTGKLRLRALNTHSLGMQQIYLSALSITYGFIDEKMTFCSPKPLPASPKEILTWSQ